MRRWLACFLLFIASPARAEPARASDPPVVELAVGGEAGDRVSARVEGWFRGHVPVERVSGGADVPRALPAATDHAGIRVWIALEDPTTARVLFVVQRGAQPPRYLVSDVPVDEGLDELGVERLGQIVYLSAMALWEGELESTPAEVQQWLRRRVPEPAPVIERPPAPPPALRAPTPWTLRVGAEYAASAAGDEGLAQAVGVDAAALHEHGAFAIGPRLRAAALVPHSVATSKVTLDLRGMSFALAGALDRKLTPRVGIPAELGVALDAVRYRGVFDDPSYRAAAGGTDVRPVGYVRSGVHVEVGMVRFTVAATGDVDLVRAHYDVADNGRRATVLTPWRVRPGLAAGASW